MNKFLLAVGALVAAIAASILSVILSGYVMATLWEWFVVTKFGVALLSIPEALGLSLLTHYATYQYIKKDSKTQEMSEVLYDAFFVSFLRPLMALGIGWIILQYI